MSANFSSVPVLDFSLTESGATKPAFIEQLRHTLINVGFLYLKNAPVDPKVVQTLIDDIPRLFALPQEVKDSLRMENSQHFLGYSRLGSELTRGTTDLREQFDFATPHQCRWKPGDPEYYRLWGPCQWPDENLIPGFRQNIESFFKQLEELSYKFTSLLAEALGLPPDGLASYYESTEMMQHRGKVVQYPPTSDSSPGQGVGAHYDPGFLTFLLQASQHEGLQVQNLSGQWIDVPPIPGTFVVNIGKALEFVTQGLARATSHRVLAPKGNTPRYSVPFFQNISLTATLQDSIPEFPPEILRLKEERGDVAVTESINFSEFDREPSGQVNLIGRIKSHPETAKRHYPDLFAKYFPQGLPAQGVAY